jgi:Putative Ig domain
VLPSDFVQSRTGQRFSKKEEMMFKSIRILLALLLLSSISAWGQISLSTSGPAISSIAPTSALVGAPSVTLTVYGKNFSSLGSTITWNGAAMPTTFVGSGKLYTVVPGKYLMTAGTVKIAVATRLGSTPTVSFTIVAQSNIESDTSAFALAPSLPNGTVGATYKAALVKGGTPPYGLALVGGAFPAGITFDGSTGLLVGAPKIGAAYAFAVAVKDSAGHSGSNSYTITVGTSSQMESTSQTSTPLKITTTSLPAGNVGSAYNAALSATGGTPPYAWRIASGALPPGLTLNAATGAVSGTPTMAGSGSFIAEVKDTAATTASYTYSVSIGMSSVIQQVLH